MTSTTNGVCRDPNTAERIELQNHECSLSQIEPREGISGDGSSPPENAVSAKEAWNNNVWKIAATFFSFIVVGGNDAVYGVSYRISICSMNEMSANDRSLGHYTLCMICDPRACEYSTANCGPA